MRTQTKDLQHSLILFLTTRLEEKLYEANMSLFYF
jgi:hypothetical protein